MHRTGRRSGAGAIYMSLNVWAPRCTSLQEAGTLDSVALVPGFEPVPSHAIAPPHLESAEAPARRELAVQSIARLPGALLREHRRPRAGIAAGLCAPHAARPPERATTPRLGARRRPDQSRRAHQRARNSDRAAVRSPLHRHESFGRILQEGARTPHQRVHRQRAGGHRTGRAADLRGNHGRRG